MKHPVRFMLAAAIVALPATLTAQPRWDLGLQGGAAFPTKKFGNADLRTGAGFELSVSYRFMEHLAAYTGWDWHRFTTDPLAASFAGPGVDVEETGYVFGLRCEHPLGRVGSPALMLRGGATLNHTEIENAGGDMISDSGHGLGWEAGAGVALPLGGRWRMTPSVRFRSLNTDQTIGSVRTPVGLSYVGLDIGFFRSF